MHTGDLVVLGDIHIGGRIVATGDVLVLGALRGFAWAGADGDESAIIYAQPLHPTQVRIGGVIAQGGDAPEGPEPEYAHVEGTAIVVEPWSAAVKSQSRRPRTQR
ncbi:septum site-determining protein MinC [mine drainage metagenome]|uniref:Septum site-determining protein MinC n=1 Tax=mine drainage metagenome TaxID=410659 RepID=T1AR96_9ZZZZ